MQQTTFLIRLSARMKMILTNYYQGIVAERESKEKYTDSSSIGHRDFPSARATEDHLFLGSRSCLCACQSAASEWTRTRRKKTGEEEGRGPRSRERARWNEADKASYRGGAGPDGIALPVSCLSRHVLASPTRNRLGYLDDSFLVLVPIQGERGGSWPRLPSSPPGLQGPRPMSLVLTSSPSLSSLLPRPILSFLPLPLSCSRWLIGRLGAVKNRARIPRGLLAQRGYTIESFPMMDTR